MRYWIVRGYPDQAALTASLRRNTECDWVTAAPPKQWEPGDRCFLWRLAPEYAVVGLAELLDYSETRDNNRDIHFQLRYLTNAFDPPLPRDRFENLPAFENASFLKPGVAQTVLPLTQEQAFTMYALVRRLHPRTATLWPDLAVHEAR